MSRISAEMRAAIIQRAAGRCEYCQLSQAGQEATFHIDHVVPLAAGGPTTLENLALACVSCSLRKGSKQTVVDPATGQEVPLFNPRREEWATNFRFDGNLVLGITPKGNATVMALQLNRPLILAIREEEALRDRHPPKSGE